MVDLASRSQGVGRPGRRRRRRTQPRLHLRRARGAGRARPDGRARRGCCSSRPRDEALVRRFDSRTTAASAAGRRAADRRHRRASASCCATCAARPTSCSTPATSTCTSCARRSPRRSATRRRPALHATVMSFGYKYGLPVDADIVVDCRLLPNPHWVPELRPLTGLRRRRCATTCFAQDGAREFVDALRRPAATATRRATPARASTTRRSPSAAPAASTAASRSPRSWPRRLRADGVDVSVVHRDLGRE